MIMTTRLRAPGTPSRRVTRRGRFAHVLKEVHSVRLYYSSWKVFILIVPSIYGPAKTDHKPFLPFITNRTCAFQIVSDPSPRHLCSSSLEPCVVELMLKFCAKTNIANSSHQYMSVTPLDLRGLDEA
jgi:hypothetical protein